MIKFKQRATASAVAALIAAGGLTAFCVYAVAEDTPPAVAAPAAPQVDVAEVVARRIVDWQNYSGRLEAIDRVDIRPLVSGRIVQVHFEDGSLVKKGDPLFTIDPRPYAAEVSRAQAQVTAAQARASWTGNDMARAERLLADNAVARRDYEEKQNASREAAANLQAAQAALEAARLNLEYTRITAPVAGRVSRAEVTLGNVVAAGAASQPLTTLMSVSKLYASFDVDEQSFLKYINPARSSSKSVIPVHLGLANESGYSREGRVASVDNRLDTSSGTIRVRAVFDNADGSLLPGLYARIQLGGSSPRDGLLIDEKAIGTDQDKRFVLVVDDKNRTAYREIKVGANQSGLRIVESGLKAGDRIVVNGLQRVRPGDAVTPRVVPMAGNPSAPVAGDVARKRV
ncbi:efflux RND transporter periplasmic adaptor subunit [Pigmentiphaga litoralis]|uniref:Multidrug efflux system membrane fusion protein n=1 Tax=Pigmentiphaga litoralis TaxID=516702 RepID=A0A7Y9LP41_9BURK|nr:efflux RND transporter periplasmic adaptor subunit [Pigmentiphaga litoralis]NYE22400.1 multidrug efflux system membrane fusion protein [Pigmentiphaga litoralis]NYE83985.1 multidrug efflux system membrane fusion protein [Pigmentiphaga litoralis]